MIRYSKIKTGEPREIVLLKGRGCRYRQCTFCDYHLDGSESEEECATVNARALAKVTGEFGVLEVICSGSFTDMYQDDIAAIRRICIERGIRLLIVESHWFFREFFDEIRESMSPIEIEFKVGVETFDIELREKLKKGMGDVAADEIAKYFRQCNLLAGIAGQTAQGVSSDVETALQHFRRVCVNVFCGNSTNVMPDPDLIAELCERVFPKYTHDPRIDILMVNTDFGVGGEGSDE